MSLLSPNLITDSRQSLGVASFAQIHPRNSVNSHVNDLLPSLKKDGGSCLMPFKKAYLPHHLHLHWFICGYKWKAHYGCELNNLRHRVLSNTPGDGPESGSVVRRVP